MKLGKKYKSSLTYIQLNFILNWIYLKIEIAIIIYYFNFKTFNLRIKVLVLNHNYKIKCLILFNGFQIRMSDSDNYTCEILHILCTYANEMLNNRFVLQT